MEDVEEEFKIEANDIWKFIILIAVGMILTSCYIIYHEYSSARDSCIDREGEFDFQFLNNYFCNNKPFLKYSNGWDWSREFNFNKSIPQYTPHQ